MDCYLHCPNMPQTSTSFQHRIAHASPAASLELPWSLKKIGVQMAQGTSKTNLCHAFIILKLPLTRAMRTKLQSLSKLRQSIGTVPATEPTPLAPPPVTTLRRRWRAAPMEKRHRWHRSADAAALRPAPPALRKVHRRGKRRFAWGWRTSSAAGNDAANINREAGRHFWEK